MIRTSVPRERAHTLTVLIAFAITFLVLLGMLVSVCRAKAREAELEAAARLGVKVIWALSLPGKVAPVTAGKSIKITIYNILHELGV